MAQNSTKKKSKKQMQFRAVYSPDEAEQYNAATAVCSKTGLTAAAFTKLALKRAVADYDNKSLVLQ